MKMVRIAETIHPRFHAPTVIPSEISNNESSFVGLGIFFLRSALCSYMDGMCV